MSSITRLIAICRLALYVNEVMVESVNSIIGLGFTTSTSIIGITACCTSGSNYLTCNPSMTGCGNYLFADSFTTLITSYSLRACSCTCSVYGSCGCVGVGTPTRNRDKRKILFLSTCIECKIVIAICTIQREISRLTTLNKENVVCSIVIKVNGKLQSTGFSNQGA